ncbi:hypothetical protein BKA80DRAFT_278657 [Phyllosticta citrichinensis]
MAMQTNHATVRWGEVGLWILDAGGVVCVVLRFTRRETTSPVSPRQRPLEVNPAR